MSGQLLRRNVMRCRGGLVFKAHRLVYHSTLGSRVIKKKKRTGEGEVLRGVILEIDRQMVSGVELRFWDVPHGGVRTFYRSQLASRN